MEAICCYETQFPPVKSLTLEGIRAINTADGCMAAEVFLSRRPLKTNDLMQTAVWRSREDEGRRWPVENVGFCVARFLPGFLSVFFVRRGVVLPASIGGSLPSWC